MKRQCLFLVAYRLRSCLISEMQSQDTQTVQHLHVDHRQQEIQTAQSQCRTTQVSISTTHCAHPAQAVSTVLPLLTSSDQITVRHFSKQQLEAWTEQYSPWLCINGNNLGCTFCRDAKRLLELKGSTGGRRVGFWRGLSKRCQGHEKENLQTQRQPNSHESNIKETAERERGVDHFDRNIKC